MNLTIMILTYNSDNALEECLNSLKGNYPILVIENSARNEFKQKIEKKYQNLKCILTNKNLGFGRAMNLGLRMIDTEYVLTLNPDTILNKDTISNLLTASNQIEDFCLLSPIILGKNKNFGYFEKSKLINKDNNYCEVDYINGFAMFFNKKKFNDDYFDENFFLYLEEIDLCRRMRNNNEKIFIVRDSIISHYGGKSADERFRKEMEFARNWHWMWSIVYYNKKHFGFLTALKKTYLNFLLSFFKSILYLLIFNFNKSKIHWLRFNGLFNAYVGKKAFYRSKLDYE